MSIILCGLPKCGKTTICHLLANKLHLKALDIDKLIEHAYASQVGQTLSVREIYKQEGEAFFRKLEKEQIASLQPLDKHVIALGGGSLIDLENVKILNSLGTLVYLKTPIDILWVRMCKQGLPAYLDRNNPEMDFYNLAKKRLSIYEKIAKITIDTQHLNKAEVIHAILQHMESFYHGKQFIWKYFQNHNMG